MLSLGEYHSNFSYPVCSAFIPVVLDRQLCYQIDLQRIHTSDDTNDDTSDKPYLTMILDYNEDREYPTYDNSNEDDNIEPSNMHQMEAGNMKMKEAKIYLGTLGNKTMSRSI